MKSLFTERMTRPEAQRIFFDYVAKHHDKNIECVKQEYSKIIKKITQREQQENSGYLTSDKFV